MENAELRECVAERDLSLEVLFGQVEEEVRAVVEKKAGEREQELRRVNEELSEVREALEGAVRRRRGWLRGSRSRGWRWS